ncbi:P protein [Kolente virus]|uniref:P protein n=1 Tax=Kolente virus TaxID=1428456 RepID=V5Q0S5_9RHAB|nr:P protein [Kolente virus]AHB08862.1 P protein [Kolente virus]
MERDRSRIQKLSQSLKWDLVQNNLKSAMDDEEHEGVFETGIPVDQIEVPHPWEKKEEESGNDEPDSYDSDSEEEQETESQSGCQTGSSCPPPATAPGAELAGTPECSAVEKEAARKAQIRKLCKSMVINRVPFKTIKSQAELDEATMTLTDEILSSLGLSVKPELSTVSKCSITMYYTDLHPKPPVPPNPSPEEKESAESAEPGPSTAPDKSQGSRIPNVSEKRKLQFLERLEEGILFKRNKTGSMLIKRSNPSFSGVDIDLIVACSENNKEALEEILRQGGLLRKIQMLCKWPEL